jgi:hypothetical protein
MGAVGTLDNLNEQKLDLSQSRVEVAYTGDQIGFRKKLVKDISLLFVYDMLYGGNMKEALQSSLLTDATRMVHVGHSSLHCRRMVAGVERLHA